MKIDYVDTAKAHRVFLEGKDRAYMRLVPDNNPLELIMWHRATDIGFELCDEDEFNALEVEFSRCILKGMLK